jgi:hypothetical protein
MSPHQAVAVAVRLFAVWLGLDVLRSWATFAFVRQSDVPGLGVAVAFLVLTAFLGDCPLVFSAIYRGEATVPRQHKTGALHISRPMAGNGLRSNGFVAADTRVAFPHFRRLRTDLC